MFLHARSPVLQLVGVKAVPGPASSLPVPVASSSRGPKAQENGAACVGSLPTVKRLGFASDFLGSHCFPHLASRLSRLWSLPCSSHDSFCGGWISSPFRPPALDEEWPLPGCLGDSDRMDPKNRNPNWDRWGPKDAPQGSQSWGKIWNLSWRLKTGTGKSDGKEEIPVSTPGDGGQPSILKTPLSF
jgi:hypothetical protein